MANSGSTSIKITNWNTLKFTWMISSQSIPNNSSSVDWKMELISGSDGRIDSSASKKWSVTINGTSYSGSNNVAIANNTTKTLASGTTPIAHNSNGTKTFSYSFSQQFSITFSGTTIGTKSGSGSGTLNTIPRASSLSASNGTLGTDQTLTISRADSSFTHSITYKCGNASGTIATKTTSTSTSFTPPLTLANQNTSGASVTIIFTLTTYSGDNAIGTATKTINCAIPSSVKPSISLSVTDANGHKASYGSYVQGLSKFKIVISASGSYGSTIKSYKTTAEGKTYTSASFTTEIINTSGTLSIVATVTDSRGRTASASTTATILSYSPPKINSLSVMRCDAQGNKSPSGAYLAVLFKSEITNLNNKNTALYTVQYKKKDDTSYTTETLTDYANQFNVSSGIFVFPAITSSSYNIIFNVEDAFKTTQKTASGSSITKLWSILSQGLGIAFNKVAEFEGIFDIGFKTKFTGGIQNEVLEKITDLNDVLVPNTYVSVNKGATSYTNCPIATGTFVLECMSAGAEGQLFQRLTSTFKEVHQRYERHYYQGTWGAWVLVHSDSGWVNLTLQSGISYGSEHGFLKGRLKNNVLYVKGDVKGITANWKNFAQLPSALMPEGLTTPHRFGGVYNMSNFCGMSIMANGQLYVTTNSSGSWDGTLNVTINESICI